MNRNLDRILMAYRPLYLRGLLLDGQYHLSVKRRSASPAASASPSEAGKRRLLVTLIGPVGRLLPRRRKSC